MLLVIAYHFWPSRLNGGYIGVDVFFVISGFLITAHLVREATNSGRVDVPAFWARRVRRLLPASLLVLLASTVATLIWVPAGLWNQFLTETAAAAGYVVNWVLAASATDYLGAANHPSPVQHYWSLSAEEQFYLVWPLLLVIALLMARRLGAPRIRAIAIVLGVIVLGSLIASIVLTAIAPAAAYFVTPTRAWEFGAGGLLAIALPRPAALRPALGAILSWAGLVIIAASALLFTAATPFPGIAAALPVMGALLVLAAGSPASRAAPSWLMARRPVQFLGDISYSLYLWHWPLLIIAPYALGHPLGTVTKVALLVTCLVLATATKLLIEDPVRSGPLRLRRPLITFAAMIAAIALVIATPTVVVAAHLSSAAAQQAADNGRLFAPCVGAASRQAGAECAGTTSAALIPARADIYDDTQGAFSCYVDSPGAQLPHCSFGSRAPGAVRVALVGDSHGAMLVPALRDVAAAQGWRVDVYVGRGCVWSQSELSDTGDACHARNAALQELFQNGARYDIILLTSRRDLTVDQGSPSAEFAHAAAQWAPVAARGTKILALADNPLVPQRLVDCVLDARSDAAASACSIPRDDGYRLADGLADAARTDPADVSLLDLSRYYCSQTQCPMVIGGVIVYRDRDHLTASYSRTLAPYLVAAIEKAG